ncbi:MAG: hypothetical protein U0703_06365 [Anaerolineae bacterium]
MAVAPASRDLIDRTHKILMAKDYIGCQITGECFSDPWSSKGLIHLTSGTPPADYYRALGLPETLAPRIFAPHAVVGEVTKSAAEQLGPGAGTPVVCQFPATPFAGLIGTGAVGMGRAAFNLTGGVEMIGRAQAISPPTDSCSSRHR